MLTKSIVKKTATPPMKTGDKAPNIKSAISTPSLRPDQFNGTHQPQRKSDTFWALRKYFPTIDLDHLCSVGDTIEQLAYLSTRAIVGGVAREKFPDAPFVVPGALRTVESSLTSVLIQFLCEQLQEYEFHDCDMTAVPPSRHWY